MWSDKWLGHNYRDLGRGPEYDCLGLWLAVQREEFGRDLPELMFAPKDGFGVIEGPKQSWRRVDLAGPGCSVLFRWPGWWHIGTAIDARHMLHIESVAAPSHIVDFSHRRFGARLEGIYEYVG